MRDLAARTFFATCRAIGAILRSSTYARVTVSSSNGAKEVRKRRLAHAPLLVRAGEPLVALLNTGMRVLRQAEWEARERALYQQLYNAEVHVEGDGILVLPFLEGVTLAALLRDRVFDQPARIKAIGLAAHALAAFHAAGLTHADAMAENVMVHLDADVAKWFDFETLHDPRRPLAWRRADDLRALIATSLLRIPAANHAGTVDLILEHYGDRSIMPLLAASFESPFRRSLPFHLGQASLSFETFVSIGRLVKER